MADFTFQYRWKWSLQSSVDKIWPYISNTDRFRGATGFPKAKYSESTTSDGEVHRVGRIRVYGFPIEWEEEPFEWIRDREVIDTQNYRIGPLKQIRVHIVLEPRSDGGTDLSYHVKAKVGNILGYPGIPVQIGIIFRYRFERAFRQMDRFLQQIVPQPFIIPSTPMPPSGRIRLREMSDQLVQAGHDRKLVDLLGDTVLKAPDADLTRMRAYAYADKWHVDRHAVLEMFLRATQFGMLDLSWDMLCPECRGAKHTARSLRDVTHQAYCPSCNIHYEVDFARSIEATFQVNSAIKAVNRIEFCLGSPQNTPHIPLQQTLAPGESRSVKLLLEPDHYRWRVPKLGRIKAETRSINTPNDARIGRAGVELNTKSKNTSSTLTITDDAASVDSEQIGAGVVSLTMVNQSQSRQIVLLEQTNWSSQSTTAAEITSLQSFRDLFSSEALRPGESIGVERLTIMFTDLKGSTEMYRTVGDAPAFRRVMDHFTILRDGVASHQGALVKTIGDAIMAVFTDPVHAMEASEEILANIEDYNTVNPDANMVLKMGIHQGTCIAVTLNDRLDYFGTVVNLASRLEGQSRGNDLVVSEAIASDAAVHDYLAQQHLQVTAFQANLKGFESEHALYRVARVPVSEKL